MLKKFVTAKVTGKDLISKGMSGIREAISQVETGIADLKVEESAIHGRMDKLKEELYEVQLHMTDGEKFLTNMKNLFS